MKWKNSTFIFNWIRKVRWIGCVLKCGRLIIKMLEGMKGNEEILYEIIVLEETNKNNYKTVDDKLVRL